MTQRYKERYRFTNHALERFRERFNKKVKGSDNTMGIFAKEFYCESKVNKSIINNTRFMTKMHERYGYDAVFEFRTSDDAVFVCRNKSVITVYPRTDSIFGGDTSRFKRKK